MTAWSIERDPGAYVTEIAITPEPRELQVLHSPMPGPEAAPERDEPGPMRQGPRKLPGRAAPADQNRIERNRSVSASQTSARTTAEGPKLPTRAALNRATRATAAAIADPESSVQEIHKAAELEAATLHAYWHTPGAQAKAELEREPEAGT